MRGQWALTGLLAGLAGLATAYLAAAWLGLRGNPVTDVAQLVIRLTPGSVAEHLIQLVGRHDKPLLVTGVTVVVLLLFALFGLLSRQRAGAGIAGFVVLGVIGLVANQSQYGAPATGIVPSLVGVLTWLSVLSLLTAQLRPQPFRDESKMELGRRFVLVASGVGVASAVVGLLGRKVGGHRRAVDAARDALNLPGVTDPGPPSGVEVGLDGITAWQTPSSRFYRIDTALVPPAISPEDWSVRIHGMVDREITLTYDDLIKRPRHEIWMTLNCVSNTVGGPLISNAWWSGTHLKDLLTEAGVQNGADAVKQTSDDGWTCGTPLSAMLDDRGAMLVYAMNGEPLPIEHGFPVRTLVPGMYGYVSACKWVRQIEVTTFDSFSAYWTERGWSPLGPVKLASRIDVPGNGDHVKSGQVRVGGLAWQQNTGISAVQVQLDGSGWRSAELARENITDSWVQWVASLDVPPGRHQLAVRAVNKEGQVQTAVRADPVPNGASGWHTIGFTAD
ncbi:MAG TPA: molybdopterin-dependent oxidoreductase [Nocardioides sp.]|jgi:DMSO/TMAO reductase YedYZ molybdopterin-dependent catalytic subunit|uniref:molybdopterin-dependent oxidoreductase n=1 Tax=Nocardioides sp. TaxID=35761 RepID=UPI002E361267|nr:molybdopterin-dependent oxidoreductase [Nocardioides sp.]HEX3932731.1 molybdopterin-dependent oxidoreductase [Nocardioides sp.]